MTPRHIRILLVEDSADTSKLVEAYLARFEAATFEIIPRDNGEQAIAELEKDPSIDLVLMDYYLPGMNGMEVTKLIKEKNFAVPIVFLTVNKDMSLAVEVMKLGVEDYLIKEEISSNVFPQTLVAIVERRQLKRELAELEVKKRRLEAMQQIVVGISGEITEPLKSMKSVVDELMAKRPSEKAAKYLEIIQGNLVRLEQKMVKLQNLREDKTVQYIKDIKMIDIS